jgi:hypothetical protein
MRKRTKTRATAIRLEGDARQRRRPESSKNGEFSRRVGRGRRRSLRYPGGDVARPLASRVRPLSPRRTRRRPVGRTPGGQVAERPSSAPPRPAPGRQREPCVSAPPVPAVPSPCLAPRARPRRRRAITSIQNPRLQPLNRGRNFSRGAAPVLPSAKYEPIDLLNYLK